jgi:hypothetical protein
MGTEQTWDIVLTPRDRWCLAALLLADGLVFKSRKEHKELNRARLALGLYPATERLLDGRAGRVPLGEDRTTYRRFTVTSENAAFFVDCLNKLEKGLNAGVLAGIEPALQQLENEQDHAAKMCAEHPEAAVGEVTEDWSRSTAPLLDQPHRLVDEVAAIMQACRAAGYDIKVLVDRFLEEAKPPTVPADRATGRPAKGGHLTEVALNAPPS